MHYQITKLFLLFILPLTSFAQLKDDFSDGDFTNNPSWGGDAGNFTINSGGQLQLNSLVAGSSCLSTPLNVILTDSLEWHFFIRLNFSPSSNNYARVYLLSDQQNLGGSLNGYYLQFGESLSNDAVELFKQSGTTAASICRGTNAEIANSFSIGVKVICTTTGQWTLFVDASGGTNYIQEATGTDLPMINPGYFGVSCVYTSSNIKNIYFDNFHAGPILPEIQNPDGISIEPEIFSPDDDGKDDVVNIQFHFETSGYFANVKVFDSKGRPVRTLVSNELIGNNGAFSWDGFNDNKEKARTGIYVFYIQLFDPKGNVKEYKRTCVLATRF